MIKRIPSFQEYVLVSQKEPGIEVSYRAGDSWTQREGRAWARVAPQSIGCALDVDEIYRSVFEP